MSATVLAVSHDRSARTIDMRGVRRFAASVPALQTALAAPIFSPEDVALRSTMRRTMSELSHTLRAAADGEPNDTRAAIFLAAAMVASQLAALRVARAADH